MGIAETAQQRPDFRRSQFRLSDYCCWSLQRTASPLDSVTQYFHCCFSCLFHNNCLLHTVPTRFTNIICSHIYLCICDTFSWRLLITSRRFFLQSLKLIKAWRCDCSRSWPLNSALGLALHCSFAQVNKFALSSNWIRSWTRSRRSVA